MKIWEWIINTPEAQAILDLIESFAPLQKSSAGQRQTISKTEKPQKMNVRLDIGLDFLSSDNTEKAKFVFPKGTNQTLVRWFNDIYGDFTVEETRTVWEYIKESPEIKEISDQIWYELEVLMDLEESWGIW